GEAVARRERHVAGPDPGPARARAGRRAHALPGPAAAGADARSPAGAGSPVAHHVPAPAVFAAGGLAPPRAGPADDSGPGRVGGRGAVAVVGAVADGGSEQAEAAHVEEPNEPGRHGPRRGCIGCAVELVAPELVRMGAPRARFHARALSCGFPPWSPRAGSRL